MKSSLASPLFTADLYHDGPGIYDFGKIDSTKYTGTISYVPVDSKDGFWGITSKSYGIGSSSNMVQKDIKAIVDTGTTLLLVPEDVLKAYYKDVTGAKNSSSDGGYTFPCDATLPDFYIGIGDYTAMVPASAINTGPASGNGESLQLQLTRTLPITTFCRASTNKCVNRLLWWYPIRRPECQRTSGYLR